MNFTESTASKHSRKRHFWLLLALPLVLGAGFFAVGAHAADEGFGFGPPGMGGGGTPEAHKAFMERRLDRMLTVVNATDAQRSSIKAIFDNMFVQMQPIHQQRKQLHAALVGALTADPVDGAAVEKQRVQVTALMDQGSQVFTKALVDAAQVLTPEQRQTLAKHMQEHRGRRRFF